MEQRDILDAFDVDFQTGRLFWRNPPKAHAQRVGDEAGFICCGKGKNKSYWYVRLLGRTLKRSRVIFYLAHGRWPDPCVDHINGDSLDDRPSNLRQCTYSENTVNSKPKSRVCGLPQGVYKTKQGRFMARLTVQGNTKSLGTYDTPELAERVYLAARKEVYSEFA